MSTAKSRKVLKYIPYPRPEDKPREPKKVENAESRES